MIQRIGFLVSAVLVMAIWAAAGTGDPQEKPAPAMKAEEKVMIDSWLKYAAVGAPHKMLAERAGQWEATVKFWSAPGAPPEESTATADCTLILGGRYLVEKVEGTFNGMTFSGMGITGYDNIKQRFVSVWMDSMSTGIMQSEGVADGATIRWMSETPDPIHNRYRKTRGTDTLTSADTRTADSFDTSPDGKEFKNMEIVYTRKK
jgi:hypothetical protein